ncbi:MAG: hypothetical protein FJX76_07160 [Armatimonadetes bacterium]|nr:hypothetical protein [Armatimonadota bacterium]
MSERRSAPFTLRVRNLHVVPIHHYDFEFAHCVRRAILANRPAAVAVELPPALREAYFKAVRRFPRLSVVSYENATGETMLLPVEPTDPFSEAVRTSLEASIPAYFVDLQLEHYPRVYDPMPDPYVVYRMGLEGYWNTFGQHHASSVDTLALDRSRELHMAGELLGLMESVGDREVLFVCGMAHARNIVNFVESRRGDIMKHADTRGISVFNPNPESVREIASEMPFLIAVYERQRGGPGPEETWENAVEPEEPPPPEDVPRLEALSERDLMASLEALLGMNPKKGPGEVVLTPELMRALSKKLGALRDPRLTFSLFGNAGGMPPTLQGAPGAPADHHRIFKFRTCNERRPELKEFYASCAARRREEDGMMDRQRVAIRMLEKAAVFHHENTGETVQRWQLRTLVRYARSYARLTGNLIPDFFQWLVATRGVSDDNYAYEVYDLGSFYPWQKDEDDVKTIEIHADEIWLGERRITFRRRFPRFRERMVKAPVRQRRNETKPGDWVKEFNQGTICSYPPEDVVIENYGLYLKKKALLVLSEERARTEPFATSLLDGIDMRETIRNWPEGKRIYVRETQKVSGGAGSVVLIFDEDSDDDRYPWKMTWHGEHEQESDMAFYSTPMGGKIVGPGIARCEYGGLMLTYPPGRLMDVWSDPFYAECQTKAEVLLTAGLEYSKEKHVIYVASKPPRTWFKGIAGKLGRKIVYLPIGQLSPVSIKKIRVFHVLSGHHLREIARDYVW